MHKTDQKVKRFSLHAVTRRLLLWGLRILCLGAFCVAVYIEKTPALSHVCLQEMLHSLCLAAVLLALGAFVLDVDIKKKEES